MTKLKYLRWWDLIIITVIMIGMGIYQSNIIYFTTLKIPVNSYSNNVVFTSWDNFKGIFSQVFQLIIVIFYLKWRKFDFFQWKFKIDLKNTLFGILLFFLCALTMDIWFTVWSYLLYPANYNVSVGLKPSLELFSSFFAFDFSQILYSLLNGPYEEIFFLGVCLSINPKYKKWVFWYSIVIRSSFHTYQGLESAFGIGIILTVIYYFFYTRKNDNLYPYFLSHTIADILGLGIIYRILYLKIFS